MQKPIFVNAGNIVDVEQDIKETFMKIKRELYEMREQLKCLENVNMFQKSPSDDQKQNLLKMSQRLSFIEIDIEAYPRKISCLKSTGSLKKSANVGLMPIKVSEIVVRNSLQLQLNYLSHTLTEIS